MKEKFFNLANSITLSRAFLAVIVVFLISYNKMTAAIIVFSIAAFTDAIDGFVARLKRSDTKIGAFLDPVCDKILIIFTLTALFIKLNIHLIILLIFTRDILVIIAAIIIKLSKNKKKFNFKANIPNKIVTVLQIITIFSIFLFSRYQNLILTITLIITVFAITSYIKRFKEYFKNKNI